MNAWERKDERVMHVDDRRHVPVVAEGEFVFGDFGIFRTPPLGPYLVAKCAVVVEERLARLGFVAPYKNSERFFPLILERFRRDSWPSCP